MWMPRGTAFQAFLKSLRRNENGGNFFFKSCDCISYFLIDYSMFCSCCPLVKRQFYYSITVIAYLLSIHIVAIELSISREKTHNDCHSTSTSINFDFWQGWEADEGRKILRSYPTIVAVQSYWMARRHIFAFRQRIERTKKEIIYSSAQTRASPYSVHSSECDQGLACWSTGSKTVDETIGVDCCGMYSNRVCLPTPSNGSIEKDLRWDSGNAPHFRGVGISSADIAAFIEEVEHDFWHGKSGESWTDAWIFPE